ncbi:MAG: hypothetical protein PHH01_01865 [Patescibacteria group bacterium]|nr:hypothetical protein [Patescibacteria group bacterium]
MQVPLVTPDSAYEAARQAGRPARQCQARPAGVAPVLALDHPGLCLEKNL